MDLLGATNMMMNSMLIERSLLIVDTEKLFVSRFAQEMKRRGYLVTIAGTFDEGLKEIQHQPPAFIVIDLRLGRRSGLDLIKALKNARSDARGVIVTRYDNLVSAVIAVRVGAKDYFAKPVDIDKIERAFNTDKIIIDDRPLQLLTPARIRWEHIHRVCEGCGRNISRTARQLSVDRRTIQRIFLKYAPA